VLNYALFNAKDITFNSVVNRPTLVMSLAYTCEAVAKAWVGAELKTGTAHKIK